jgi:hypothetical protein
MMAASKAEKIKISIVILLSVVLLVLAYFRFTPSAPKPASNSDTTSHLEKTPPDVDITMDSSNPEVSSAIPETGHDSVTQKENLDHRAPSHEWSLDSDAFSQIRDLFSPLKHLKKDKPQQPQGPHETFLLESLDLKGTIFGGEKPIAIINDQFVRPGDRIGGYQIVKIAKDVVILDAGGKKTTLEILKND